MQKHKLCNPNDEWTIKYSSTKKENNERLLSDYLNRSESLGQLGAADWVL